MFKIANASRALPRLWLSSFLVLACVGTTLAQANSFTYQGRLHDGGAPANGAYEIQFTLWDAIEGGTQQPQPAPVTLTLANIQVTNGLFTVPLDFGATAFPGEDRYLEISIRRNASDPFTTLAPRQQTTSTPYAIRSLSAGTADSATNATQLGGVDAARFVQSDAGGNVNIAGDLTISGSFSLDIMNAQTQYNLGGQRILSNAGNANLFVGAGAGASNSGIFNTFVGTGAGFTNTTGNSNAFFGVNAGLVNTSGANNSFFGDRAGGANTTGDFNSFFGFLAGLSNTTGLYNTLLGAHAGDSNTTGNGNTYVGTSSGAANQSGSNNSFFGLDVGRNNTASGNSFFGSSSGLINSTGSSNSFFGASSGGANVTGSDNSFFGSEAGRNSTNSKNSFFGRSAGKMNTGGFQNTFAGFEAGLLNETGDSNTFVGAYSGRANTTAFLNSFFGFRAGLNTTTGCCNSFFGNDAGLENRTGRSNVFFGGSAGGKNTTGSFNAFFGDLAGYDLLGTGTGNTAGNSNTFFGNQSGRSNTIGGNNTTIGAMANVGANDLTNASAIGANALVSNNNSMVLGSINGLNGAFADTNVGIGTPAPQTRLQVKTAPGFYGFTHTDGAITVGSYVGGSQSGAFGGWLGTASNHPLYFFINDGQPSITVDTTGNVGVGANAPKAKLEVAGGNLLLGSPGQGIILKSPNGATCRLLSIDNAGVAVLTAVACP